MDMDNASKSQTGDEQGVELAITRDDGSVLPNGASDTTPSLQRKLNARHVQMIAIGSCIGTGLLIGSGKILHTGGPLALVLSFFLVGLALAMMMQSLTEISVVLPVTGGFTDYAIRFGDDSLGFAIGWQYWLAWVSIFGAEASAFTLLIEYWDTNPKMTPLWISIFIIVNLIIHLFPVRVFAEVEFVVSCIKVLAIIVFIIVVWVIMGGGGPAGVKHGGENWTAEGLVNGTNNGFRGIASGFVTAAFACGGTEMVAIVAGEMKHPRRDLPKAVNMLMWRIFLFYVVSMLFLTFVVRYDNDSLIGASKTNSSPFIQAIKGAGIPVLPDILNAVVMICVSSVASSSTYIASRTLKTLADKGFAFRIFAKVDSKGRPREALLFTSGVSITLAYLNCSSTGSNVFSWFSAISGMAFFLVWMAIIFCSWRFRAAVKAQNDTLLFERHAYRQRLYPWMSIIAFILFLFMVICQLVICVSPIGESASATSFFSNFISVPIFLVMWAGYKLIYRTRMKPLMDIDLQTGRKPMTEREIEEMDKYKRLALYQRALTYLKM